MKGGVFEFPYAKSHIFFKVHRSFPTLNLFQIFSNDKTFNLATFSPHVLERGPLKKTELQKVKVFKYCEHCKRTERCSDRLSGNFSDFALKAATLATLWKKSGPHFVYRFNVCHFSGPLSYSIQIGR